MNNNIIILYMHAYNTIQFSSSPLRIHKACCSVIHVYNML